MPKATVEIENVLQPGKTYRVDAEKYAAARAALLAVLPATEPGFTQAEMSKAMRTALSVELFPGTTTGWWMKAAQLDLEAKGAIIRLAGKPLRWRRA